ncbi:MAG: LysR family transcriptional regulator [Burkholderiaceae bacterium]|nr:LysR family transcriptional regulator [Burkholderiaceae bacterium]
MELRQLRYFVRVLELGSISRAALDLDLVQSALSQQISRLEGELSTRLLQRTSKGVVATEAGMAFFREAQLTLRHADQAVRAAQLSRLTGAVSVGLASTTAAVLGLPLMRAMRERYPDVRLHMVEGMSGHLTSMLNSRQLDLTILFDTQSARRWSVLSLVEEKLFLIRARPVETKDGQVIKPAARIRMMDLKDVPLILPTGTHGLRSALDAAFVRAKFKPQLVAEIDSLAMTMAAVEAGLGGTVQPWAALAGLPDAVERFIWAEIADTQVRRVNAICSLSDDELSPAALAARVVLADCARELVMSKQWLGVKLIQPQSSHHDL